MIGGDCLSSLDEEERDLLMLRFGYGWTLLEIARLKGQTEGNISRRVAAAVAKVGGKMPEREDREVKVRLLKPTLLSQM